MKALHTECCGRDLTDYISRSYGSITSDFLTESESNYGVLETASLDDCRISRLKISSYKMSSTPLSGQGVERKEKFIKLFFQVSGAQEISTDQGNYLINEGDWVLFDPNTKYSAQSTPEITQYLIELPREMVLPSIHSRIREPKIFPYNGFCRPMLSLLSETVSTLQSSNDIYNYVDTTLIAMTQPFQKYAASMFASKPCYDQVLRERFVNYVNSQVQQPRFNH